MNLIYSLHKSFKQNSKNQAFCINDSFFTYQDLLERVIKIRSAIVSQISSDEKYVGLIANNDLETYATMFALWMEGKAYIPISPSAPLTRNLEILNSINVKVVFDSSENSNFSLFKIINATQINDNTTDKFEEIKFNENNVAYVLFTSGSTGAPKGIPISFKNLNALITELDIDDEYKLNSSDRCLQMYDLTFDASLTAILPALLVGACLYTVPSDAIKYFYTYKLLEKYKLTVLKMVPSIIYYLRPYFEEINAPSVRYSIFGGEKLYEDIVKEWVKCIPNSTVLNHYGPTEFTVCSTYYKYKAKSENKSHNGVLSIGKPFKNVECIILNNEGNVVPENNEGELCLSGDQLTPGYWNNEALNTSSFFMHKTESGEVKRFYKTGDLCFKDENGYYMYVGRKDFQVKIGGYRVELGEVEYHARNHESTKSKNILVIDVKNSSNNDEIVLVIESIKFDAKELMEYMSEKLTDYMVPKKVFFVDNFPHNKNGKIDRKQLRDLVKS
ncbi:AMP-dependent synthetase [Algibacter marinivivus]|uniref:AMP-dependent synthetase n=1 Tax=Algibacter marinivivus TaxID=2100723 RepID=A0A2U2X3Q5_9FLAO|nr:amino acid adenylation domain-containing protein [Algibacter marinivivus]PWH82415.1 AMP-dependent synthetase [Algibacter marinivivus]